MFSTHNLLVKNQIGASLSPSRTNNTTAVFNAMKMLNLLFCLINLWMLFKFVGFFYGMEHPWFTCAMPNDADFSRFCWLAALITIVQRTSNNFLAGYAKLRLKPSNVLTWPLFILQRDSTSLYNIVFARFLTQAGQSLEMVFLVNVNLEAYGAFFESIFYLCNRQSCHFHWLFWVPNALNNLPILIIQYLLALLYLPQGIAIAFLVLVIITFAANQSVRKIPVQQLVASTLTNPFRATTLGTSRLLSTRAPAVSTSLQNFAGLMPENNMASSLKLRTMRCVKCFREGQVRELLLLCVE
jgi:hypothetical protein